MRPAQQPLAHPPSAPTTRPTIATLCRENADLSLRRICVWGDNSRLPQFWDRVSHASRGDLSHIVKIQRVLQSPSHTVRFDVYYRPGARDTVRSYLQRSACRWGWYLRDHRTFWARHTARPSPSPPQGPAPPSCPPLRVATLNVNGLASKVEDITALASLDNLDCLLLQETLVRPRDRLPGFLGYRDFHAYGDRVASDRGCCILVRDRLRARLVGHSTPCWLSVRLEGPSPQTPALILTSVYLPSGSQGEPYRGRLLLELARLRSSFPSDQLVVAGDWNLDEAGLQSLLGRWQVDMPGGCTTWPSDTSGRRQGTCRRGRGRVLDHFVSWGSGPAPHSLRIDYTCDTSDHWPVHALVPHPLPGPARRPSPPPTNASMPGACPPPCPTTTTQISGPLSSPTLSPRTASPLFPILSLRRVEVAADRVGSDFVDAIWNASRSAGVVSRPRPGPRAPPLQRSILAAITRRRRAYARYHTARGPSQSAAALRHYSLERRRTQRLIRNNRRRARRRAIERAASDLTPGSSQTNLWQWAATFRDPPPPPPDQPVRDPDTGSMHSEPLAVNACWARYFTRLLSDPRPCVTAHRSFYTRAWPARLGSSPALPTLPNLDLPFDLADLNRALRRLKNGKATGLDGIPSESLKLAIHALDSRFGTALLSVINGVFLGASIPA